MEACNYDILIFILDDNLEIRNLLQKKLYTENYKNVVAFSNLAELNDSLLLKPDIIILDNILSEVYDDNREGINNFVLLKGQLPVTNFIIFSGVADPGLVLEFMQKGAYGYIVKDTGAIDKLVLSVRQISLKR